MLVIEVCVGSSCFLRGAEAVIRMLQELVERHGLGSRVVLKGSFCMENCTGGVTIRIGDRLRAGVFPQEVPAVFARDVLGQLGVTAEEGEA